MPGEGRRRFRNRLAALGLWTLAVSVVVAGAVCWLFGDRYIALRKLRAAGVEPSVAGAAQAAREGRLDQLLLLHRAGVGFCAEDAGDPSPLFAAVESGRADIVRYLVKVAGSSCLQEPDGAGVSLLARALEQGDPEVAEAVLHRVRDPNVQMPGAGGEPEPVLVRLVRRQAEDLLALVLRHPAADPDRRDAAGRTALLVAVAEGPPACAELLLRAGADSALRDGTGRSALDLALDRGETPVLELLVEAAEAAGKAKSLVSPALAERALAAGRPDWLAPLLGAGVEIPQAKREEWLRGVILGGQADLLQTLLDAGWRPSGASGADLLRQATEQGRYESVVPLLAAGLPSEGLLTLALRCGHQPLADLLFSWKPPATAERDTLLQESLIHGNGSIARRLLAAGADTEGLLAIGQRPLALAVARGRADLAAEILERGADPNRPLESPCSDRFVELLRGREGFGRTRFFLTRDEEVTPLMLAAMLGELETAQVLMRFGGYPNRFTRKFKYYPVNFASQNGHHDVMRLVLGRDPNRRERRIEVSLADQRARVYRDEELLFETRVSTGRRGNTTPAGKFVITNKYRTWTSTIYDSEMPYFMRLSCSDFGFHQGVVPGYPASHGCIRVPSGTAKRLYQVMEVGDFVEILP